MFGRLSLGRLTMTWVRSLVAYYVAGAAISDENDNIITDENGDAFYGE